MGMRITILGAGPGGYVAAVRAARSGAKVTVIEAEQVGGTCLNWGCIPTKTLLASAEALNTAHRLSEFGIRSNGGFTPDAAAIMARKERVIQTQIKGIEALLKANGVNLVRGRGTVLSPQRVRVDMPDGRTAEVPGDRLILATGSRVTSLPAIPIDGRQVISSNEALLLQEIPRSMIILGGGVVGMEFAFIMHGLGTAVTVIEAMERVLPLPSVDPDVSRLLQREMKKRKIGFHPHRTVAAVRVLEGAGVAVTLGASPFLESPGYGGAGPVELRAEKLLVSIGRAYNTDHIGLAEIGLKLDDKGRIPVNDRLETNLPGVIAVGDVLGPERIMLAHVATAEGIVAADNCLGGSREMDYRIVPSGIFTVPEIGCVGLSEPQAVAQGIPYRADTFNLRGLGKAQAMGELAGLVKLISGSADGRVLGVHLVGAHATEIIAEAAVAMRMGATTRDLAETIHLHPSLAEGMMEVASAALDEGIHVPPLKKG